MGIISKQRCQCHAAAALAVACAAALVVAVAAAEGRNTTLAGGAVVASPAPQVHQPQGDAAGKAYHHVWPVIYT